MSEILQASLQSSGGFALCLVLDAVAVKILASGLGPAGMGLLSLLRQIHQATVMLATFGGQNTLAQGMASRRGSEDLGPYGVSALWIVGVAGLVAGALLLLLAPWAAVVFPQGLEAHGASLIRWLVAPILVGILAVYFNGVLTAWRDVIGLSLAQLADAVVLCLIAWPVARLVNLGYPTALIAMMTLALSGTLAVNFARSVRRGYFASMAAAWRHGPQREQMRAFFTVGWGALAVSLIGLGTLLAVRALIAHRLGLAAAGLFDTSWALSQMYVWLLLASITTWYLPTLSNLDSEEERAQLIAKFVRFVVMVMTPVGIALAALKPLVIQILYTSDFLPALYLWRWFLIGDYLRATAWVLSMAAFARADMRAYVGAEFLWNASFLAVAVLAVDRHDVELLGAGYVALYWLYLAWFAGYARRRHGLHLSARLAAGWAAGLALVVGAAALCWHTIGTIDWPRAAVLVAVACAALPLAMTAEDRRWVADLMRRR